MRVLSGRVFEERDRDGRADRLHRRRDVRAHPLAGREPARQAREVRRRSTSKDNPWMEIVGRGRPTSRTTASTRSRASSCTCRTCRTPAARFTLLVQDRQRPRASPPPAMRAAMRAVDPDLPLYAAARRSTSWSPSARPQRRLAALLITVFAAVALRARGGRDLRRDVVRGRPAHAGDRHPHGARRRARRASCRWCCATAPCWRSPASRSGCSRRSLLARLITSLLFQTSAADPPTFSLVPLLLLARRARSPATCRRGAPRASTR